MSRIEYLRLTVEFRRLAPWLPAAAVALLYWVAYVAAGLGVAATYVAELGVAVGVWEREGSRLLAISYGVALVVAVAGLRLLFLA